jgi:hypothetical protein
MTFHFTWSHMRGLRDWMIGFIDCFLLETTNQYNILTCFHTTSHSTLYLLSLLSLVTTLNNGYSFNT